MANKSRWPVAVIMTKNFRRIGDFMMNMKALVLNIKGAPLVFVTPVPTPTSMLTHLSDLEAAEAKAKTRVIGAAADRDTKFDVCWKDLKDATAYVQTVANAAADAAAAIAIIEASGLTVRVNGLRVKAPIAAKNSVDEGKVDLTAKSGGRDSVYQWQQSPDGIAWTDLPLTQLAKTSVDGLTPTHRVYFRVRTITKKDGTGDWSAAVAIIVV